MLIFKSGDRVNSLENSFPNIDCTYQSECNARHEARPACCDSLCGARFLFRTSQT